MIDHRLIMHGLQHESVPEILAAETGELWSSILNKEVDGALFAGVGGWV